ncbi:MAG: hypothetical protein RL538_727 [Candidatus Parcubacteria bacterium]|jgi:hypothetical protein
MSFPILTKDEFLRHFREKGVNPRFFDPHAIDAVGTCYYHTIKDDVVAGAYSFEHFIRAYVQMEAKGCLKHIHDVRSFASWLKVQEASGNDADGGVDESTADIDYFISAELAIQQSHSGGWYNSELAD